MVKRKSWVYYGYEPFVLVVPFYKPAGSKNLVWTLVHEYSRDYEWLQMYGYYLGYYPNQWQEAEHGWPPMYTAKRAALNFAANNQIVTDVIWRANILHAPYVWAQCEPRYNIYRGQRGQPLIPCIYWDFLHPTPPPGYLYYYLP